MMFFLTGCLDHTPIPGTQNDEFVAMQSDFADYTGWSSQTVGAEDTGHVAGDRVVYINAPPPAGAATFPVGTLIVKTIAWEGGLDIHARAKRGGGFNQEGAVGWEWFELTEVGGVPVIKWRGEVAPAGEVYQALPGTTDTADTISGDCNICHSYAATNDFVFTVGL